MMKRYTEEQIIGIFKESRVGCSREGAMSYLRLQRWVIEHLAQQVRRFGRIGSQAAEGPGRRECAPEETAGGYHAG